MKSKILINKNFNFLYLVLISFIIQININAQSYIQIINNPNIRNGDFVQHSIAETESGEILIVGTITPGIISGTSDILMMKLDGLGNVIWSKYIDYGEDEFAGSIIVDPNNNIIITGYKGQNGGNTPNKDLIIIKLDQNGDLINDAIIEDVDLGYSLYGLDIEYIKDNNPCNNEMSIDYIIVGVGAQGSTTLASKFGFVLKVNSNLDNIIWGYSYQSSGTTNEFDSFNHILKVNHPWGGEGFLLTGSGKVNTGNFEKQMVTNDLLNGNGVSLWKQPKGYTGSSPINPGRMSLYKNETNSFYVLTIGGENDVQIFELDAHSGTTTNLNIDLHNHNHGSYIITGMDWMDSKQMNIILTGYQMDLEINSTNFSGSPIHISVDLTAFPQPQSVQWINYESYFLGNDLQNVIFDHISQPFNYTTSYPNSTYNQFYTPKSSLFSIQNGRLRFVAPQRNNINYPFGVSFLDSSLNGTEINRECFRMETNTMEYITSIVEHNNFIKQPHLFRILKDNKVSMYEEDSTREIICQDLEEKKMTVKSFEDENIMLFPNPTKDLVYLKSNEKINSIAVYNITGQLIEIPFINNDTTLDFSKFATGVYFIETDIDGQREVFKLIKK